MATRLGYPAVTQPRAFDLNSIRSAVDNIRQRLGALDTEVTRLGQVADAMTRLGQTANASTLPAQVSALTQNLSTLTSRVNALEAALLVDDVINLVAGETVKQYDPIVMISATACGPADGSDPERIHAVIGVAKNGGAPGQTIEVQRSGSISIPNGSFDVGRAVYVGIDGLTQYPTYGDFVVPVGVATAVGTLWISPGDVALQRAGLYGSAFDDFLPVTWGLAREQLQLLQTLLDQPDGLVVKIGDQLTTRVLVGGSGSGITIDNADGVDGDPIFTVP
jgi:hypothetical protein